MVELKFAELQTPLFLEGVNHGVKLDPSKRPIKLHVGYIPQYQTTMLMVSFKGARALIPLANTANTVPLDSEPFAALVDGVTPERHPYPVPPTQATHTSTPVTKKPGRPSAQVSTPTSHVFAGEPK